MSHHRWKRPHRPDDKDLNALYCGITDFTQLKKLIWHTKTKAELITSLAKKVNEAVRRQIVVALRTECKAMLKDVGHLQSGHEEDDLKMILQALNAIGDDATVDLSIHSPERDILVLPIRWYSQMCSSNPFLTGRGAYQHKLQPIVEALSPTKTAALEFNFRKPTIPSCVPLVIWVKRNSLMVTSKVEFKSLSANFIHRRQTKQLA